MAAVSGPAVSTDGQDGAMEKVHKITTLDDTWQPGDVVLDDDGQLWVRSDNPQWVWDHPLEGATRNTYGGPEVPEGGYEEADAKRPLVLLVRGGRAVGGRAIEE
jgi:hypothetical protein